ncbi:DUF664 domain-containing protein [Nocardioides sp.]|nr:DUF664 domain-containing protein [Nocardioides sp.]
MSRDGREPSRSGPSGAARWSDYLDWVRDEVASGVLRLSPEQQRTSLVPSGWTPLELLSHVLHMEQRWFVWGFLGATVADPWGDWDVPDPSLAESPRWRVSHDVTAEDLAARLEQVGVRTRDLLASYPLDTVGATGGRFAEDPPTLEWICFHVLAEYARHAGHLDIVVEIAG